MLVVAIYYSISKLFNLGSTKNLVRPTGFKLPKGCVTKGGAPEFGLKVEEDIYVISLEK